MMLQDDRQMNIADDHKNISEFFRFNLDEDISSTLQFRHFLFRSTS